METWVKGHTFISPDVQTEYSAEPIRKLMVLKELPGPLTIIDLGRTDKSSFATYANIGVRGILSLKAPSIRTQPPLHLGGNLVAYTEFVNINFFTIRNEISRPKTVKEGTNGLVVPAAPVPPSAAKRKGNSE
jgi:hypothetical protein